MKADQYRQNKNSIVCIRQAEDHAESGSMRSK